MQEILEDKTQLVVLVLLTIYILSDIKTPPELANSLSSFFGNMIILLLVVYLLLRAQPVVAVLGIFSLYELVRRGQCSLPKRIFKPVQKKKCDKKPKSNEEKKLKKMMNYNQFSEIPHLPVTLEESVIKKRLPLVNKNLPCEGTFKPVLDDNIEYGVL